MVKIYVVDTNVLIQAPYGMQCFEDNQVVLPVVVLEELDNLKKAEGETGANVRTTIRMLEELRLQGDLLEGVTLPGGEHFVWRKIIGTLHCLRIFRKPKVITGF